MTRRQKWALFLSVAVAMTTLGVSAAMARQPDTPQVTQRYDTAQKTVTEYLDGRVLFEYARSMQEATSDRPWALVDYEQFVLQGSIVASSEGNGCTFEMELDSSGAPTDNRDYVYVARQLEGDRKSCSMLMEGAWVDESVASLILPGVSDEVAASEETVQGAYSNDGWIKGYTEDPVGLDVTSSKSRIRWNGSGCPTSWIKNSYWGWFTQTFWTDTSTWKSYTSGVCWEYNRTYGAYKNGVFCATNDTFSKNDVTFTAKGSQYSSANWSLAKWGGCSWLLSTHITYDPY